MENANKIKSILERIEIKTEFTEDAIACLEEIAFVKGFISREELRERGESMAKTGYGQYLLKLAAGEIRAPEI